jgi:AraC-like DNA-binding protein
MQAFGNPQSRIFSDENIQNLVQNSISEFSEESRLLSDALLTHSFEMILIYLLRNFPTSPRRETLAKVDNADIFCYNIMNYIDTHIFTMKNLEELSEVTNYNYSYLSSLFRKTTGRTLVEYYQSSRFRIARSLVMENKVKISDIAALLNYSSVYAFSKAYKKEYGVCPRESKKSSFLDP